MRFKVTIPDKPICHNHQAPFDFFAAAFFELYSFIIFLGPRLGGKTLDFAILSICESIANNECEGANFGAVEAQAMRCYGYIKNFLQRDHNLLDAVKGKITLSKTEFKNNSWLQVLVATLAGVNSPHPQKLKADEVELIPWVILQEAFNMPQTKDNIKATTVLGSTRKFAHGPMQRLIDDELGQVFTFCIWEVMEKWPEDPLLIERIKKTFIRKFGDLNYLPKDLTKFNGFFKWEDLITRVITLDEEVFRTQLLCQKADSSGLIYPKFDEVLNDAPNFIVDRSDFKPIQIWEDFGYARPDHPNAIGLVQLDMERMEFTIFDELYIYESGTQDIVMDVIQMLQRNDLVAPELKDISREQLKIWKIEENHAIIYSEFFSSINLWIPDYHGLTEIADRKKYGCPIPDPSQVKHEILHPNCTTPLCPLKDLSKLYLKENGIPHVRLFVDERRMKMVMEKTPNSRNDFMSYAKKKLINGTWSDQPEKQNDHACDYVHYGTVYNWYNLAYQPFPSYEVERKADMAIGIKEVQSGRMAEVEELELPEMSMDDNINTDGLLDRTF